MIDGVISVNGQSRVRLQPGADPGGPDSTDSLRRNSRWTFRTSRCPNRRTRIHAFESGAIHVSDARSDPDPGGYVRVKRLGSGVRNRAGQACAASRDCGALETPRPARRPDSLPRKLLPVQLAREQPRFSADRTPAPQQPSPPHLQQPCDQRIRRAPRPSPDDRSPQG